MPPRPWAPSGDTRQLPIDRALREREPTEKAVQSVQVALSDPDTEPEIVADCVEKLSEWIRRQAVSTQRMILQCRLSPVLVQVMKKHGDDLEVARHCCRVVGGVCNRSAETSSSFAKAGVVVALNSLLDMHLEDSQVQESGMQCLLCLATRVAAREVIATGGLGRCLRTLAEHPDNTYIQRNAWQCMDSLIANGGELNDAMRREIVEVADLVTNATGGLLNSSHPKDKATKKMAEKLVHWVQTAVVEFKKRPIAVAPPKKVEAPQIEEAALPEREQLDLRLWLFNMDSSGALAQYHGVLAENFDSVTHIVDAYTESGKLDPQFFEDSLWHILLTTTVSASRAVAAEVRAAPR